MALLKRKSEWSPRLLETMDASPEVGYVTIAELNYDWLRWIDGKPFGYQRPLDDPRVAKYVNEYDPHLIGAITANRRADGSLWVLDGQHRCAVLVALGQSVILATVYNGLTAAQEAETYGRLNVDRRSPNLWNKFGSRASAGDPIALAVVNLASGCGFRVGTSDRSLSSIAAVNTLERLYALHDGPRLLRTTLTKIAAYWPTAIVARDGVFIEGLARFIYTWDGSFYEASGNTIDWKRADNLFSLNTAGEIAQRAKQLRIEAGIQMSATTYSLAFRDIYNGKANYSGRLSGNVAHPNRQTGHKRVSAFRTARQ